MLRMAPVLDYSTARRHVPWRIAAIVVAVTIVHFILVITSERFLVSCAMDRAFGFGPPAGSFERIVTVFDDIASLPLIKLLEWIHMPDPGNAGFLLFGVNSLFWGMAVGLAAKRWSRRSGESL
jgi:hypothetical protein